MGATPNQSPGFTSGGNVFGRIAPQWDAYFSAKVDNENGIADNLTVTGTLNLTGAIIVGFNELALEFLEINANAIALPTKLTGALIQTGNADGVAARIEADAFGAGAFYTGRRADGTNASPTMLTSGDEIVSLNAWGYDGSDYVGPKAAVRTFATGTWSSGTSTPTEVRISTTPSGSTTMADTWHFAPSGGLYADGVTGGDKGIGTVNATNVYVEGVAVGVTQIGIQGSFKNLKITNGGTPNSQRTITADAVVLANGSGSYFEALSVSVTISSGSSGANGLDTGSVAASTVYYEYVIYNGTTVSGLMSLSSTSPMLPSGYTYFARVGAGAITDGSSHFYRVLQLGRRAHYVVTSATNTAALPTLSSGASGNVATPTWTALALQNIGGQPFAPPTASVATVSIGVGQNQAGMVAPNNSYGAYNGSNIFYSASISNSANLLQASVVDVPLESTSIYYANQSLGLLLLVGWEDNL